MGSNKFILFSVILAAVVLVSGCAQQQQKQPVKTQQPETAKLPSATPVALPTQVGAAGDVIGSELAKSDAIESDLSDADLDQVNSDLTEVQSGL